MRTETLGMMWLNVVLFCAVGFISVPSIHGLSIEPFDVFGDGLISAPGYVCTAPCTNTRTCTPGCVCALYNITCAGGAICSVVSGRTQLFCLCPSGTTQVGGSCVSNGATPATTIATTATTATTKSPAPPTCIGFSFQRCFPRRNDCPTTFKCGKQEFCDRSSPDNTCPCPTSKQACFLITIKPGTTPAGNGNGRKKRDVGSPSSVTIDNSPAVVRQCNQVSKPRHDTDTNKLDLYIEFEAGVNVKSCTTKLQETYVDETESDLEKYNFCTLKDFLYNNKKNHISTRSFVGVDVAGSIGQFILTRPGPPEGPKGGYLIQRYSVFCTNTDNEISTTEYFYVAFQSCQTCKFQKHHDNCPDAKRHMYSLGKENICSDPDPPVGSPCLPTFSCTPDSSRILTLDNVHWHKAIEPTVEEDSGLTSSSDEQPVDLDNSTPETTQPENAEAVQGSSEAEDESTTSEPTATDATVDDDNKDNAGNEDASSIGTRAFAQSRKSASSDSGIAVSGSAKSQSSSEEASSSADK